MIYRHYVVKDPKKKSYQMTNALVRFNPSSHLEMTIYKSNLQTVRGAGTLFGLKTGDTVYVKFLQT
ncbi:MAG: hypothetical protein ACMUEM_03490 [Flavobacteriales bacterium AspAUS03]